MHKVLGSTLWINSKPSGFFKRDIKIPVTQKKTQAVLKAVKNFNTCGLIAVSK